MSHSEPEGWRVASVIALKANCVHIVLSLVLLVRKYDDTYVSVRYQDFFGLKKKIQSNGGTFTS